MSEAKLVDFFDREYSEPPTGLDRARMASLETSERYGVTVRTESRQPDGEREREAALRDGRAYRLRERAAHRLERRRANRDSGSPGLLHRDG